MPPRGIVSSLDWHRVVSSENCPTQRILILDFQKNTCVQYCHFDPKVQIQNLIFSLVSILTKLFFVAQLFCEWSSAPQGLIIVTHGQIIITSSFSTSMRSYLYHTYPLLRIYHIYLTNITFICDKKTFYLYKDMIQI